MDELMMRLKLVEESDTNVNTYIEYLESRRPFRQQHAMEEFIDRMHQLDYRFAPSDAMKVLEIVIGAEIERVNFGDIMRLYPDDSEFAFQVLDLISTKAVCTKAFSILANSDPCPVPPKIDLAMVAAISKMLSLTQIEISEFRFTLDELLYTCSELKLLSTLNVMIDPERSFPIDDVVLPLKFQISFGQLRTFYFSALWSDHGDSFQDEMTRFCIEHLENVQDLGVPDCFVDMTSLCKADKNFSQLKCLMLSMDNFEQEECHFDRFLCLKSLYVGWSDYFIYRPVAETKMHLLTKLSTISELKVQNLESAEYFQYLLEALGTKLETLFILNDIDKNHFNVDLKFVHDLCPQLLSMFLTGLSTLLIKKTVLRDFKALTQLEIIFNHSSSQVILSGLLAPPALEIVSLLHLNVARNELANTVRNTKRKKILTRIQYLKMDISVYGGEKMKKAINEQGDKLIKELEKNRPCVLALIEYKIAEYD